MANPRLLIGIEDQGLLVLSLLATGSQFTKANFNTNVVVAGTPGLAVSMASNNTVSVGTAGDRLAGVVVGVDTDLVVSVVVKGTQKLAYSSTAPLVGSSVECNGDGTVRAATSTNIGSGNIVLNVDTTGHYVWVLI